MKIDNYLLVRMSDDNVIGGLESKKKNEAVSAKNGYIVVMGEVYGHQRFPDGLFIRTSPIVRIEDCAVVTTQSGSKYNLGEMNPDYKKFKNAVNRGIPILTHWSIGQLSNGGVYVQGVINRQFVVKAIVKQNDNVLYFNDGTKAFVDWTSVNSEQLGFIKVELSPKSTFCKIGFKVDILGSNWSLAAIASPLTLEELTEISRHCIRLS